MSGEVIGVVAFLLMAGMAVLVAIVSAVSTVSGYAMPSENDED